MEINVAEVMTGTTARAFVKERKADPEVAFKRMDRLIYTLESISRDINSIEVGDTEESWKDAYEQLYVAFQRCIAEEKVIIMGA